MILVQSSPLSMDPEDLFIHVDEWSRLIRQAIDGDRAAIDMVNHYIVVTLLFAVVQGLMIHPVLERSLSTLQGAATIFAFLGFSLDLGGTFPGALYLGILHARRHTYTTVFNDLAQFRDDFKIVVRSSRPKDILDPDEQDGPPGHNRAAQVQQMIFGPQTRATVTGGIFQVLTPRLPDSDVKQRLRRGVRLLGRLRTYPFVRREDLHIIDNILELEVFCNLTDASQDVSRSPQDNEIQAGEERIPINQPAFAHQGNRDDSLQGADSIDEPPDRPSEPPPDVAVVFFKLFFCTTFLGGFFLGLSMISLLLSFERTFESCLAVICCYIFLCIVFLPVMWQKFAFPQFLPSQSRLNVLESNML